jgi:hypothetical protein
MSMCGLIGGDKEGGGGPLERNWTSLAHAPESHFHSKSRTTEFKSP